MDILKKFFPYSFKSKNSVTDLVVNLIVYIVAGFVVGALIGLIAKLPIIGVIFGILGGAVELYVFLGLVLSVLDYLKVLK